MHKYYVRPVLMNAYRLLLTDKEIIYRYNILMLLRRLFRLDVDDRCLIKAWIYMETIHNFEETVTTIYIIFK
ncbi:MAG: hypothetical protein ACMUJM_19260 [bacterium]